MHATSTSAARAAPPTTTTTAPQQRSHLTIKQKIAIIQKKVEEPRWTQERLGRWAQERFQLAKPPTQATVSNILRAREQLMKASVSPDFCRVRAVKYPDLDAAVHSWVLSLERSGVKYAGDDIKEKALQLVAQLRLPSSLAFSNGWVTSFMERHQLKLRKSQSQQKAIEGESSTSGSTSSRTTPGAEGDREPLANAPIAAKGAMSTNAHVLQHQELPYAQLLARYAPRDVFAMDEVGLFYCIEPKKSKSRRVSLPANSKSRARISVALAVNMDATEKLEQFFVGTEKRPAEEVQCLRRHFYNSNAWVTGPIFQDWLLQLNCEMLEQNRHIILLVDDAPSHVQLELSNVKTLVLPAKRSHPFSVGISRTFKALFRIRHLAHAVDQAEQGAEDVFEVEQLRAMRWAKQAWLEVSPDVVRRCWDHSGLGRDLDAAAASSSTVKMDQSLEDAICGYLAHLNLLYQVSIESILCPMGEDDVHYVYNDATISGLVLRKSGLEDAKGAASERGDEDALDGRPSPAKKHRGSKKQRVELYRDVIAMLDEDSEIDEHLVHAIQFLRRKQAAARLDLKQSLEPLEKIARHESAVNILNPAPQPPRSPAVVETTTEQSRETQEPITAMILI
ncbi:Ars-binding protein [Globisporangium polare]